MNNSKQDFLFECLSEEMPYKMQSMIISKIPQILEDNLAKSLLTFDSYDVYTTPRRFAFSIRGLVASITNKQLYFKGPKVGSPDQAINGFIKNHNVEKSDLVIEQTNKGSFFFLKTNATDINIITTMSKVLKNILNAIQCPKTMRWGSTHYKWIRPVRNILCMIDNSLVDIEFCGIKSTNTTFGHRISSGKKKIVISSPKKYSDTMKASKVILKHEERLSYIKLQAKELEKNNGIQVVLDTTLLNEVASLVEFPYLFIGKIKKKFMTLPEKLIISVMQKHQKYFHTIKNNKLASYFVFVANHDGSCVVQGNEKVLAARLCDAMFLLEADLKHDISYYLPLLKKILFHRKLGDMYAKSERIAKLATYIGVWVPMSPISDISKAAMLCKADLNTSIVKEFPKLAGFIGSYYAHHANYEPEICEAINQHYFPIDANSSCTNKPSAITLSIADKLDSLVGLMSAGERVKGSKDPYGLRRMTIGIIRVIIENSLGIPLSLIINKSISLYNINQDQKLLEEIKSFFFDRLIVMLKSQNISQNICNAVIENDALFYFSRNAKVLHALLETNTGKNFISSYKRIIMVLKTAESKSEVQPYKLNTKLILEKVERDLVEKLHLAEEDINKYIRNHDFISSVETITNLHFSITSFMDSVLINCDCPAIRSNRLSILSYIRYISNMVARFESIIV